MGNMSLVSSPTVGALSLLNAGVVFVASPIDRDPAGDPKPNPHPAVPPHTDTL
ncbi:hypothetical protein B0H17DRAFT_1195501 [Mycena rosella]|uniref:Uncharacterized protein n=1 Tax=Mycena rosella TaxID=1033263 RepID=A0AAD7DX35_MYCRO|nr:hypothetical protein B0H17DRAFT_1195501 [Mycena rosella]